MRNREGAGDEFIFGFFHVCIIKWFSVLWIYYPLRIKYFTYAPQQCLMRVDREY